MPFRAIVVATLALCAWLLPGTAAWAETAPDSNITVASAPGIAVIVTAERSSQAVDATSRAVEVVTAETLREHLSRSVPESLHETTGILVQRTNQGGGSPFLRGLTGNQVLLMTDGIRINNSTVRGGPNQYLNTIDPFAVEQIEIVRGIGSVLYGSDALGGVVNVITRRRSAFVNQFGFDGTLLGRVSTGEGEETGAAWFTLNATKHTGLAASYSRREFDDVDQGGLLGDFVPSGYTQEDATANLDFRFHPDAVLQIGTQWSRAEDVPNYSPGDILRNYDPQVRKLTYARLTVSDLHPIFDVVEVTGSFHDQREGRNCIRPSSPDLKIKEEDRVKTWNGSLRVESKAAEIMRLVWGYDLYDDAVSGERIEVTRSTGAQRALPPNVADGSSFRSQAFYVQGQWAVVPWMRVVPGLRFTNVTLAADLVNPVIGNVPIDYGQDDLSWALNLSFPFQRYHTLITGVARGFRTPSIEELTRLGSEDGRFDIPNPNLDAEAMISYETGYRLNTPRFRGSVFGYYNQLTDLIARAPATYGGQPTVNGEPVWQNTNIGEAFIVGFEADFQAKLSQQWQFGGAVAGVYGEDQETSEPLRRIPPILGYTSIRYTPAGLHMWVEPFFLFAARQTRLSGGDKGDDRIPEGGTPGFLTANVRAGFQVNTFVTIALSAENLADRKYKYHGSGVYEPGRNFKASVAFQVR